MTIPSTPATLDYVRSNVRDLLNEFDAADGLASYYTLHHDPKRTTLFMHRNSKGEVDGFLAQCQTGIDLFRPLVTLRVRGSKALPALLEGGLVAGRPYLLVAPGTLAERLKPHLALSDVTRNHILRLDPNRYNPDMNVRVVRREDQSGNPRVEAHAGKKTVAAAGVNWRSPIFAEIYANVETAHRGRGLGWAVVNALVAELLHLGVTPLYSVDETNAASHELAERIGFVDTGAREVMAQAVRPPADE
jgi:GNAT superfamily N-acetyltransferase